MINLHFEGLDIELSTLELNFLKTLLENRLDNNQWSPLSRSAEAIKLIPKLIDNGIIRIDKHFKTVVMHPIISVALLRDHYARENDDAVEELLEKYKSVNEFKVEYAPFNDLFSKPFHTFLSRYEKGRSKKEWGEFKVSNEVGAMEELTNAFTNEVIDSDTYFVLK